MPDLTIHWQESETVEADNDLSRQIADFVFPLLQGRSPYIEGQMRHGHSRYTEGYAVSDLPSGGDNFGVTPWQNDAVPPQNDAVSGGESDG